MIILNAVLNIITGSLIDRDADNYMTVSTIMQTITSVVVFIITLFIYKAALNHIDGIKPHFGSLKLPPHVLHIITVCIIPAVISGVIAYGLAAMHAPAVILAIAIIVLFALTPLYALAWWTLIDDKASNTKDAFILSFRLGLKNYWRIIGFSITLFLISIALVVITLGIGSIALLPVMYLAMASMYRRISNNADLQLQGGDTIHATTE